MFTWDIAGADLRLLVVQNIYLRPLVTLGNYINLLKIR